MNRIFKFSFTFLLMLVFINCTSNINTKGSKETVLSGLDSINIENNKSIIDSKENITKGYIFNDSLFDIRADMKKDHRFFGYQKPNITSKKLILFSIFTNDIDGNPFKCELGSYYDMTDSEGLEIKYQKTQGDFIETIISNENGEKTIVYFEKKWIILELK